MAILTGQEHIGATIVNSKNNFSLGIRGRLFVGFGTILLALVIAIGIIMVETVKARKFALESVQILLPSGDAYLNLNGKIYESQFALQGWVSTHQPEFKIQLLRIWEVIEQQKKILDVFSSTWSSEYLNSWKSLSPLLTQLHDLEIKLLNDQNASAKISTELLPLSSKVLEVLDGAVTVNGDRMGGLIDTHYQIVKSNAANIINSMEFIHTIQLILVVVLIILSVVISMLTSRGILNYINVFRQYSKKISLGNLKHRIRITSHDELGQLGEDLNRMTDNFSKVTKQITEACNDMVATLENVKNSSKMQSSGAVEQASSINEITSSLEEIEKSSSQTIEKAQALGEVAERTRTKGQLGLDAVEQSVQGMKEVRIKVQTIAQTILELSNQTQQVGDITAVVNRLAQQSKMLALNASIEAAKAGKAGKGFAVVAAEVKNLAEQSEQSTVQVQKILEDISHATEKAVMATEEGTKGVDQGTTLVEQTGEIVRSLNDVIHEATIASQQIEAAIRQESIGIEQITAGMTEINQVTATFTDGVKQTTAAINDLSAIADRLKEYVNVYEV